MNVETMGRDLDRLLGEAVAAGEVPHAAGIVTRADGPVWQGHAGPRRLGDAAPLTADTVFLIHSMTKPLTAAGVMGLVEQGRLDLDEDCGRLLPALAEPKVLEGFAADGTPRLRAARGEITLRRLLTHSSGFVYDLWNPNQLAWQEASGIGREGFYGDPAHCPPLGFDPGTRWEYGIGIDWAGKVLEAATGETLHDYLRDKLFGPLAMTSTGYVPDAAITARLAGVHQRGVDGVMRATDVAMPSDPVGFTGGGGLYSSAADYARFMAMILNGGELEGRRVLSAETVRAMGENQMGPLRVTPLPAAMAEMTYPVDLYPEVEKGWSLSFMINLQDLDGRRRAGSLAWAGLRNSYFWIDPQSGLAAALFTQMLPFVDPATLALLDRFERALYKA